MTARDSGSVFLDTMVAAAIVALTLGVMFRTISDSAARQRTIEGRRTAYLVAQSELASVGSAIPLAPGVTNGADGALTWSVDIEPFDDGVASAQAGRLWSVEVTVGPPGGRRLARLRSLRLGREA